MLGRANRTSARSEWSPFWNAPLVLDPNSHARLKACRFSLRIEAQAKRVAVVIPNYPLGLPGGERSERPQFGNDGFGWAIGAVSNHARRFSHREANEVIFAHIE